MKTKFPVPDTLRQIIGAAQWHEMSEGESDAQVFRLQSDDTRRYLKISRPDSQFAVKADKVRLDWLRRRLPVPEVLHYAETESHQFLLMSDIRGLHPMHDDLDWSPQARIAFLAQAARRFHVLPVADCPFAGGVEAQIAAARANVEQGRVRIDLLEPQWQQHTPQVLFEKLLTLKPDSEDLVVAHGDLYPMNIRADVQTHALMGYIDVGGLCIADRYTDLAPIANAITWHLGADKIPDFFRAYGIEAVDTRKLQFYQLLNEFF